MSMNRIGVNAWIEAKFSIALSGSSLKKGSASGIVIMNWGSRIIRRILGFAYPILQKIWSHS
jgi:hypothetical protein